MKLNIASIVAFIGTFLLLWATPTNGAPVSTHLGRIVQIITDTVYPATKTAGYQGSYETPLATLKRRQASEGLLIPVFPGQQPESHSAGIFTPPGVHTPADTDVPADTHAPSIEKVQWEARKSPLGYLKGLAKHFRETFKWEHTPKGWQWVQKQGTRIGEILKKAWNWFSRVVLRRKPATEESTPVVITSESPSQPPIFQFGPEPEYLPEETKQQGTINVQNALVVGPDTASGSILVPPAPAPAPVSAAPVAGADPIQAQGNGDDWVMVEHGNGDEGKVFGPENRPGWMTPPEKKMGLPDWPNRHACTKCKDGDPGPKVYALKAPAVQEPAVKEPAAEEPAAEEPAVQELAVQETAVQETAVQKTALPVFGPPNRPGWMTPPEKNMGLSDWPGKHHCVVCKDGDPGPKVSEFNRLTYKIRQPRLKPDNWWDWLATCGKGRKLHGPENYDPDHKYYHARKTSEAHVLDHMTLPWKHEIMETLAPAPPDFEGYNPWGDPKPLHPDNVQNVNEIIASAKAERDSGVSKFPKPKHFRSTRNRCGLRNFNGDLVRLPHRESDEFARPLWEPNTDIGQYNTAALRLETEQRIMAGIRPYDEFEIDYRMPFYSDVKDWLGNLVGVPRYGRPPKSTHLAGRQREALT